MPTRKHTVLTGSNLHDPKAHKDSHIAGGNDEIVSLGAVIFTAMPTTPSSAPTSDYYVANKKYVDDTAGAPSHNSLSNLTWSAAGHTIDTNVTPTASGGQSVGTQAIAFSEVNAGTVRGDSVYGTNIYGSNTNWDLAYAHISNNGTDHLYIDQDVTISSSPIFADVYLSASGIFKNITTESITASGNLTASGTITADKVEFDSSPNTDLTVTGIISRDTVGENVVFGELLYMKSDGKYWRADADAAATMPASVLATEVINADANGYLLHQGYVRDDSWNWTTGDLLYTSATVGDVTVTAPAGAGDQVQVVGYAVSADIMYFDPSWVLVEVV